MQIYIQDHGVYGMIMVIANDEAQARDLMSNEYNYDAAQALEVEEVRAGFMYVNMGDT